MCHSDPFKRMQAVLAETKPLLAWNGEDFPGWQIKARKKLKELLGMEYLESCSLEPQILEETEYPEYHKTTFRFQSEPEYWVPGCLLTPSGKGPFPLAICLQGHSTGMHISLGEPRFPGDTESIRGGRDIARQAVAEGYCALAIEQRNMGCCGGDEHGPNCYVPTMGNLLLGRTTLGERIWDVSKALDVVSLLFPQVDLERVICTGNSGGGTVTFYAACLEPRIGLAAPSCSVCTYKDSIMAMQHCVCNFIPGIRRFFEMGDLAGLIAPRPLLLLAGEKDPIFPIQGVRESFQTIQKLYQAAGKPNACALAVGAEGHQYYPELAWKGIKMLSEEIGFSVK